MPHRSDLDAAHARIAALERELAARDRRPLGCGRCRRPFGPGDLSDRILRCSGCGVTVEIGRPPRRLAPAPPDVQIAERQGALVVSWKWAASAGLLWATVILSVCGVGMLVAAETPEKQGGAIGILLVSSSLVTVAAYHYVAHRRNRTEIVVSGAGITVSHGPMFYGFGMELPRERVAQLFVEPLRNKYGTTYAVTAVAGDGRRVRLVTGFEDVARAIYLEQAIERHLGIVDVAVDGEAPRVA